MEYRLDYRAVLEDGTAYEGTAVLDRITHIKKNLGTGVISHVTATMILEVPMRTKIFMNGYQTWTYSPEYDLNGFTEGVKKLPKAVMDHLGITRYGDYHFVDYPLKKGITHGFSYCYFRTGKLFRLFASLDERPGYTMFRYDSFRKVLTIDRDCSGIKTNGEYSLFDLFYMEGTEDEVFDAWFDTLGVRPRTNEKITGYTSWYNRFGNIDHKSITDDLRGSSMLLGKGDLFQIDDGWEKHVGDWLECDPKKFPYGMKAEADNIHAMGYRAGIWLAPFVCSTSSDIYKFHRDWLLHIERKPWRLGINWGGFWSLDIDNPEVIEYLTRVFDRIFNEWGFDLVKLDFLFGAAPHGTDHETRAGRMIRAMELLRKLCGDRLMLACGVPLMPAFGLADYSRVSCDVSLDWDSTFIWRLTNRERMSTYHAIENTIFRRQLNNRAFVSDPDVFFLRTDNIKLVEQRKMLLATVNSLFGGMLLHSDNMAKYTDEARKKYKHMLHLRDAQDIEVLADDGITVTYVLDDIKHELIVR